MKFKFTQKREFPSSSYWSQNLKLFESFGSHLPASTISQHIRRCEGAQAPRTEGPVSAAASAWRSGPAPGPSSSLWSGCIHQTEGTRQDPGPVARSNSRLKAYLIHAPWNKKLLPDKRGKENHTKNFSLG